MRFWSLLSRKRRDRELDEELQSHLGMAIRDRIERGEDAREAELAVRREFGNLAMVRETTRDMWGWRVLEEFAQDIRYALRGIRKSPGVTAVVVSSLALGIGANMALFSLVYSVMLRALPVTHPEQLVELLQRYPGEPRGNGYWSTRSYEYYRDHNHVFTELTGTAIDNVAHMRVEGGDDTTLVAEHVVGNYFPALGVRPAIGRLIGPGDSAFTTGAAAVLSWSLWASRFGQDPTVLGRRIFMDGTPVMIVGVAARDFTGLRVNAQTDVWLPAEQDVSLNLLGRLQPGVTLEQARAEMTHLFRFTIEERAARSSDPQVQHLRVELEPAGAGLADVRDRVARPLLVLLAIVGVLLLLACVNVAGILLARGISRTQEMALRLSLGASRGRLIRQALMDSCLLSILSAAVGAVIAYIGTSTLLAMLDSGRAHERVHLLIRPDGILTLCAVAVVVLIGLFCGLGPAIHAFRSAPFAALRSTGRALDTRIHRFFAKALVTVQVALALLLLSAGSLFIEHLGNLKGMDLGFRRDHVLLVTLDPSHSGYRGERLSNAYRDLLGRMQTMPGVRSASLSAPTPLVGAGASGFATAEGFQEEPDKRRWISLSWVAPKYFETMVTPILQGREFSFHDQSKPQVAIINQTVARYYFAGRNPIGRHITLDHVTGGREPATYEIVGVVGDANYKEIREADRRVIYLPAFRQGRVTAGTFVLRTAVDPASIAAGVRQVVRETAQSIPVTNITTLSDQIDSSIVPERLMAMVSGFFALSGALLAGIGLYGLLAYTVARRTNEIGIRMVLGATAGGILRLVLLEAVAIVAAGLVIGFPLAWGGRRFAAMLVQEITVSAATPLALGMFTTLALAILAAYLPARRATRVDPVESLRYE